MGITWPGVHTLGESGSTFSPLFATMEPTVMFTPTDIVVHLLMFASLYFEVFLLITFLENRPSLKTAMHKKPLSRFPTVAIIAPCYNEQSTLQKTVESLRALNYPKEKLSLLLVDDGSTDGTWKLMQSLKVAYPELSIIHKVNGGKHTALNWGIKHTDAELIGCLDADSFVHPEALTEIVRAFEEEPRAMAVIPAILVNNPRSILQWMQKAEYTLSIFIRKVFSMLDSNFVAPGPFSFFKREVFEQIGDYKQAHNTEDMEMAMRMQYHQMKIVNAHHAFVYTNTPPTLLKLVRQRVRWVYGFIQNFLDYRGKLMFRREYGTFGMLVLPMIFFAIFSSLTLTSIAILGVIELLALKFEKIRTVGFDLSIGGFDWFFFNTQSMLILTASVIAITLVFIMIGKTLAGERPRPSIDMGVYLLCYGFVAPIWLVKAVWRAIIGKETSWTAERAVRQ